MGNFKTSEVGSHTAEDQKQIPDFSSQVNHTGLVYTKCDSVSKCHQINETFIFLIYPPPQREAETPENECFKKKREVDELCVHVCM